MFQPMYYEIALTWVAGYVGGIWWFGMEFDAPKPGDPNPWVSIAVGAISGIVAVIFSRLANVPLEPIATVVVAVVVGRFAGSLATPFLPRRTV